MEKIILSYITANIPNNPHQHGFKTHHSTSTALHQLTNQITQGFNKPQPPDRTIVVSLDLSKTFDTVNILSLIHKLHQTNIPPTIIKYIANYIKGYTLHLNATSRPQQFKTGVPQGGVRSPTLFNIYTSNIPKPPKNTTLTTYADDMNPAASHYNYLKAQDTLQPYLEEIHSWTKENDLILNPDKSIATPFTPDPAEYNKTLNLRINNTLIPTVKTPKY